MTIDLRYGDTIEQMKLIPDKSIDFICCEVTRRRLFYRDSNSRKKITHDHEISRPGNDDES